MTSLSGRRPGLRRAPWPNLDFTGRRRPASAPAAGHGPAPLREFFSQLRTTILGRWSRLDSEPRTLVSGLVIHKMQGRFQVFPGLALGVLIVGAQQVGRMIGDH